MTIADLLVIYLSCGAPFGVLVFLSKHSRPTVRTIAESVLATLFWPLLAVSWMHRRLLLRHLDRRPVKAVPGLSRLARDPFWTEYETLTRAVIDARTFAAHPSGKFFEVAGHSNPSVAAACAERKRNALLNRRQQASSAALIEALKSLPFSDAIHIPSIADDCRKLGDSETARSIEQLARHEDQLFDNQVEPSEPARLAA